MVLASEKEKKKQERMEYGMSEVSAVSRIWSKN